MKTQDRIKVLYCTKNTRIFFPPGYQPLFSENMKLAKASSVLRKPRAWWKTFSGGCCQAHSRGGVWPGPFLILVAKLCGSQQEGRVKGAGCGVLKLSELEHWGVQVLPDEPEPQAEMLSCSAAWHLNGNIADHNHCSGSPSLEAS